MLTVVELNLIVMDEQTNDFKNVWEVSYIVYKECSPFSGHYPRSFSVQVLIYKSSYLPLIHLVLWNPADKRRREVHSNDTSINYLYHYPLELEWVWIHNSVLLSVPA